MDVNGRPVLFQTVHGSRLYGTAHADSDYDLYTVVDRMPKQKAKYAKQTIIDGIDSTVVDFGTWVGMCQKGVPQALEAMFSTQATYDRLKEFRSDFRVNGYAIAERYLKTMKAFIYDESGKTKYKVHGLRLALNLHMASRYGRFNPTLSIGIPEVMLNIVNGMDDNDELYEHARGVALGLNQ